MNTRISILALTAAVLTVACDPFDKVPGGTAQIVSVFSTQPGQLGGNALVVTGTNTAGTWNVGIPTVCDAGAVSASNPLLFVAFSRLMSGASIQTAANNCAPASNWLTATGALPAGTGWNTCYNPQSTVPGETSYVVIFPAATPGAGTFVSGWDEAVPLDGGPANVPYTFRGTVNDSKGNAIPVAIDATLQFPPVEGLTSGSGICSTTTTLACTADADCGTGETCTQAASKITLSWDPPGCGTTVTGYKIERAPNQVYSAGEYTTIVATQTGTTYTEPTALAAGQNFWYRVTPLQGTAGGSGTELEVTAP